MYCTHNSAQLLKCFDPFHIITRYISLYINICFFLSLYTNHLLISCYITERSQKINTSQKARNISRYKIKLYCMLLKRGKHPVSTSIHFLYPLIIICHYNINISIIMLKGSYYNEKKNHNIMRN